MENRKTTERFGDLTSWVSAAVTRLAEEHIGIQLVALLYKFTCMAIDPPLRPPVQAEINLHELSDPALPLSCKSKCMDTTLSRRIFVFDKLI